jgi:hypothetical protein
MRIWRCGMMGWALGQPLRSVGRRTGVRWSLGPIVRTMQGLFCPSPPGAGNSWISDDGFESRALRFHPNAAIVPQHLFRDMTGNVHDGLVGCAALRKLGGQGVPVSSRAKSQCPAACSGERREIRRSGLPTRTQDSRVRCPSSHNEIFQLAGNQYRTKVA